MVSGINKPNGRSHWGIPCPGENEYTGMFRFRSTHFPKNIRCICQKYIQNTVFPFRGLDKLRKATLLCKRFQIKFINITSNNYPRIRCSSKNNNSLACETILSCCGGKVFKSTLMPMFVKRYHEAFLEFDLGLVSPFNIGQTKSIPF